MADTITNNFYEGSQKVDHIDKQENHYHYHGNQPEDENAADSKEKKNPLIRFILNNEDRKTFIDGLLTCEDTGQLAAFLKRATIEDFIMEDDIRSADFHRTIKPLLIFETTERAIKEAILKQLK